MGAGRFVKPAFSLLAKPVFRGFANELRKARREAGFPFFKKFTP